MSCCGGGSKSNSRVASPGGGARMSQKSMPGSSGMTLVEYTGSNFGNQTFYGPVTGVPYTFSAAKSRKNVDRRDLHFEDSAGNKLGILDLMGNGKNLFVKAVVTPVPQPVETVEPAVVETLYESESVVAERSETHELTEIKGIGATSVIRLNANGITMISEFMATDIQDLQTILGRSETTIEDMKSWVIDNIGEYELA